MLIILDIFWNEIKTIIPQKKSKVGRLPKDVKLILSGIFYIISSGVQRRLLPDYYGKTSTVHCKFRQLTISGCFEKILQTSIDIAIKKFGSPECFINNTSPAKAPCINLLLPCMILRLYKFLYKLLMQQFLDV